MIALFAITWYTDLVDLRIRAILTILLEGINFYTMSQSLLTKEERNAKSLAKSTAREEMYQLVAKIISWKTRAVDSHSMQHQKKISASEWKRYEKHLLEISKEEGTQAVKEKLALIHEAIELNQGFE